MKTGVLKHAEKQGDCRARWRRDSRLLFGVLDLGHIRGWEGCLGGFLGVLLDLGDLFQGKPAQERGNY